MGLLGAMGRYEFGEVRVSGVTHLLVCIQTPRGIIIPHLDIRVCIQTPRELIILPMDMVL